MNCSRASVQAVASDGACFELAIGSVKKAEAALFRGSAP
jgi:hypothetical protein